MLKRRRPLVRSLDADVHLELFLVAAVAAILFIRFYLKLTGYPRVGAGGVHVAHMLWGGLMMLAAIVIVLTYLNRNAVRLAAVLGGIGFGTFIDEVGKFVTKENDYFYQPAFALMYVLFVLLILVAQSIQRRMYTPEEYLLNAIQELEELVLYDLDAHERRRALQLLEHSDPNNPLVEPLHRVLLDAPLVPPSKPGIYARSRRFVRRIYERLTSHRRFRQGLVIFFVGWLLFKLANIVILVFFPGLLATPGASPPHFRQTFQNLSVADWGQMGSTVLSGILVAAGVAGLASSRYFAYRMFKRSVLVTIFITQLFMFYDQQLSAVVGLALNVLLLLAIQTAIDFERQQDEEDFPEQDRREDAVT
jgi:hypothetical protein